LNILVQHPGRQFKAIEGRRTPFTIPMKRRKLRKMRQRRMRISKIQQGWRKYCLMMK
jgi:hypothetical protein